MNQMMQSVLLKIDYYFQSHFVCNLYWLLDLKGNAEFTYFVIPFYLQSVPVHSANCVKMYTMACRRELSSDPLQLTGSRPLVAVGNETYKLNLKNHNYKHNNYTMNLVGR
jgi:hypothetical protein